VVKALSLLCSFFLLAGLFLSLSSCRPTSSAYIILCAGNSLTGEGYPPYLGRLLRQRGWRVKIYNYGRNGHNSGEYLNFLRKQEAYLKNLQPDFILLELGTNDVRLDGDYTPLECFVKNMREIIKIFSDFKTRRGEKARLMIALIPPIPERAQYPFSPESSRRVEAEINPALLKLARENNLPVVDHWHLFRRKPELLPDVHPEAEGYREMARTWFEALLPYLASK